ncbi:MAG: hypothetical protein AUJ85_10050 [Elusimicrobia bacterium CG1_02_37_114]|nr:MAG: hypothetical protein AUJ85_10050 [Elusimicrobia bacterium CG1_02_37_114]PIV53390.1 MAG: hypothetical protein COS17_04200 [Elusimicrobia bacterium CG02_land_8_20_14_3_00_37_13]PIZ13490.1 MAG: hypothetical protein COY53_04615 [Elusimicrobia bacterium CG_4_10_14_0_8_um_filter_37_32]
MKIIYDVHSIIYLLSSLLILSVVIVVLLYIYSHRTIVKERNNLTIAYHNKLRYLNEITESLRGTLELEKVFIEILNILSNNFGFTPIFVYLVERFPDANYFLRCIACPGAVSLSGIEIYDIPIDGKEDPIYPIIENREPVKAFESEKIKKIIKLPEASILPIVASDRIIGLLITKKIGEDQDLLPLTIFANQSGFAIENAQLYKKTQELTIIDELTQVYNRRYFDSRLPEELELAKRYKSRLSFGMADIDDFKYYNDKNGHQAGDECLKRIAAIMGNSIRSGDVVARYGGEEFVIILPATDKNDALIPCEKIRSAVETAPVAYGEKQPLGRVTLSIGIATFPTDAKDVYTLVNQADRALYMAKDAGKNKVVVI